MRTTLGSAVVYRAGGIEGATSDQEPLEQNSLLELEVVAHSGGDVGRLDGEGNGDVSFLQDVVDFEVADNAATCELLNLHCEFLHLL